MLKNKMIATTTIAAGLLVGSLGLAAVIPAGVASAQTATTQTSTTQAANPSARTGHPALRNLRRAEFKVAADTIGVKPVDLRADVKGGQSVADVATAKSVSVDTVVNAVVNDATAKIDQAVANGKLSQDRATKIEAKLPAIVTKAVNAHHSH
jgi:spermidine/putrescine-binding protein